MNIRIIRFGSMELNLDKNIISTKHKVHAFEETLTRRKDIAFNFYYYN